MGSLFRRYLGKRAAATLAVLGFALGPSSAQAQGLFFVGPQIGSAIQLLVGSGGLCVSYTYDKNGNRTAQTAVTIPGAATNWGAGMYGCFVWHS